MPSVPQDDEVCLDDAKTRDEIRQFRASMGLLVDDAVLDELVEAWRKGRRFGIFETDEERRRLAPHEAAAKAAELRMQTYAREHADSYAGRWLEYECGAPMLVVAFTGPLEAHRVALDLPRVRVIEAERTYSELEAVVEQLNAERFDLANGHVSAWGPSPERGVVFVRGLGSDDDRQALAKRLRSRFGDAVELDWNTHGPARRA